MLSAFIIDPKRELATQKPVLAWDGLMLACYGLARIANCKVHITWQHNIRDDHFAIIVEAGKRTFGHFGKTFVEACLKTTKEIGAYREELRTKAKPASREAGRARRRR